MAGEERFTWRVEVEFAGTLEEFNRIAAALSDAPVRVLVSRASMAEPHGPPGIVGSVDDRPFAKALGGSRTRFRMPAIKDVCGGIRNAHMHVGDEVILLDVSEFKALAAALAAEIGGTRAGQVADYVDVIDPIARLGKPPGS